MSNLRKLALAAITIAASNTADAEFELEAMSAGTIDDANIQANAFFDSDTSDLRWQETITRVGADYLRLHLSDIQNAGTIPFTLVIKDGQGRIALEYSHNSLPSSDFWTPVIFSGRALVQIRSLQPLNGLSFKIDKIAFQTDGGGWLSLIGTDDREHIIDYRNDPVVWGASQSVAKLSFFNDGFFVCTGFMLTENKMLTNHHCVAEDNVCSTTVAIFGYYRDENGTLREGEQVGCKSVLRADFDLDYALLELQGDPGNRWGMLELDGDDIEDDATLFIIQHPAGEPKQISRVNCNADGAIVNGRAANTDLAHVCDTLGGSSGSPVFTENGKVVGLHHFGVGQAAFWDKNRAVRMKLVLDDISDFL